MTTGGIEIGQSATLGYVVTDADTAIALGSGDLPVLATPRLLAWCEAATCRAVQDELAAGDTTVGSRVALAHLRPSPVGAEVLVRVSVVHLDGRLVRYDVAAEHADGTVVGHGEVTRVIVDGELFLARLG
jgi:fluoroacetyl-CoA thioesterase